MTTIVVFPSVCLLVLCLLVLFPGTARAGDSFIALVPERSLVPVEETPEQEQRIIRWLQSRKWIGTEECPPYLKGGPSYMVTARGEEMVTHESRSVYRSSVAYGTSGVYGCFSVNREEGKQVFHSGQSGLESAHCRACGKNIGAEAFCDLASLWHETEGNIAVSCPLCDVAQDISSFKLYPQWGFGTIAFFFWNFPGELNDNFLRAFASELGEPVRMVQGKL